MKSLGLIITLLISGVIIVTAGNGNETTPRVVSYTLVNVETNEDIHTFTANASFEDEDLVVLDLTGLANPHRINIRVNTEPPVVDGVSFGLDGDDYSHLEFSPPYALFGDHNGNYKAWQDVLPRTMGGSCLDDNAYHICFVDILDKVSGGYNTLYNTFFRFRLKYDDIRVTGFTLINAVTDQEIADIHDGDLIDLSSLPTNKMNVRANTEPSIVGSVLFNARIEAIAPYSLYGDRNGNYHNWLATPGVYQLQAIPYSKLWSADRSGVCGIPLSVSFQLIQTGSNKTGAGTNGVSVLRDLELFPNPNEGIFSIAFSVNETSDVGVEIFDMLGKSVFREELLSFSGAHQRCLDLSAFPEGVYVLSVDKDEKISVRKFVISRR